MATSSALNRSYDGFAIRRKDRDRACGREFVEIAPPRNRGFFRPTSSGSTISAVSVSRGCGIGDAKIRRNGCRRDFQLLTNTAGLKFDPSHVHVYADSLLVEGTA